MLILRTMSLYQEGWELAQTVTTGSLYLWNLPATYKSLKKLFYLKKCWTCNYVKFHLRSGTCRPSTVLSLQKYISWATSNGTRWCLDIYPYPPCPFSGYHIIRIYTDTTQIYKISRYKTRDSWNPQLNPTVHKEFCTRKETRSIEQVLELAVVETAVSLNTQFSL